MTQAYTRSSERSTTLLEAARMFAKARVLEQYENVRFMAAHVDARKEIDSLRSGSDKAYRSWRPRPREKGRRR